MQKTKNNCWKEEGRGESMKSKECKSQGVGGLKLELGQHNLYDVAYITNVFE